MTEDTKWPDNQSESNQLPEKLKPTSATILQFKLRASNLIKWSNYDFLYRESIRNLEPLIDEIKKVGIDKFISIYPDYDTDFDSYLDDLSQEMKIIWEVTIYTALSVSDDYLIDLDLDYMLKKVSEMLSWYSEKTFSFLELQIIPKDEIKS